MIDVLHAVDLGFVAHVIGNIMLLCLAGHVFGERTMPLNLERMNEVLQDWYRKNKVTSKLQGPLTMERIRGKSGWPKLKAKGAAGRHLAPFAHFLACNYLVDRRVQALCQLVCEFYRLLDSQGMFLDEATAARLPRLGQQMTGTFAQLSAESLAKGQRFWKMTPKVHLVLHLCEWQAPSVGIPKFVWTYADEDLVGTMIEVAESCHSNTMAATAMTKWMLLSF